MAKRAKAKRTVLAVFPSAEDRALLANILNSSNWELRFAGSLAEARSALSAFFVGAVISEARFPDGYSWKDLLGEVQGAENPSPLIVADPLADETLWAEVLNLGGHDLLPKPFDTKETLRVVALACAYDRPTACQKPPKAQRGTSRTTAYTANLLRGIDPVP